MSQSSRGLVMYRGIFKRSASLAEAVFLITGMTIGAGILAIPYVVAQAGLLIGVISIVLLGLIVLSLHLMIEAVVAHTGQQLQLPGLVGKYLGNSAKAFISIIILFSGFGSILAYIVGEGQTLQALFGGRAAGWSVLFWIIGAFLVSGGLERIRHVMKFVSFLVIVIIIGIVFFLLPHIESQHVVTLHWQHFFAPYGVILFALHGSPAIAEAHALLPHNSGRFRKAVLLGTLIPVAVYALFALAVVGVLGPLNTPIATIALGERFGRPVLVAANCFAVLAMGTGFLGLATAMHETLMWDYKMKKGLALVVVLGIPFLLFVLGIRSFVVILGVVGGLFMSIEALLMAAVYWQARRQGDIPRRAYHHALLFTAAPVVVFFTFFAGLSIISLLKNLVDF